MKLEHHLYCTVDNMWRLMPQTPPLCWNCRHDDSSLCDEATGELVTNVKLNEYALYDTTPRSLVSASGVSHVFNAAQTYTQWRSELGIFQQTTVDRHAEWIRKNRYTHYDVLVDGWVVPATTSVLPIFSYHSVDGSTAHTPLYQLRHRYTFRDYKFNLHDASIIRLPRDETGTMLKKPRWAEIWFHDPIHMPSQYMTYHGMTVEMTYIINPQMNI